MPIDRFSQREFQEALALTEFEVGQPQWLQGEYVYTLLINAFARIVVRSTLDQSGVAKDTGDDSIRMWLEVVDAENVWQVQRGAESHTTRVPGWERRMLEKIDFLAMSAEKLQQPIPMHCGRRCWLNVVQKEGKNHGRPFAKCPQCKEFICFLDEPAKDARRAEMPTSAALERSASREGPAHVTVTAKVTNEDDFMAELMQATKYEVVVEQKPSSQQEAAIHAPVDRPVVLRATAGAGKCLAPGTLVMRHDGTLVPVEKVRDGDTLMGPDGTARNVTGLTHGIAPMYRVVPVKGEPFVCNGPHMLSLQVSGNNHTRGKWGWRDGEVRNVSVDDYLQLPDFLKFRLKLWRTGVEWPQREVPIDPYFFGVWLGDGDSRGLGVTNVDAEVIAEVHAQAERIGAVVTESKNDKRTTTYTVSTTNDGRGWYRNDLRNQLRILGVLGNKHIPNMYKMNSREVRLQVLAGLVDTDGYVGKHLEITQVRKVLADDIAYLARSLGFAAYQVVKMINGVEYHKVNVSGDLSQIPTRIPRKQAHVRRQVKNVLLTRIARIEPLGKGEYYGFELDGDHLFLLGDFTVTHNTRTILWRYEYLLQQGFKPERMAVIAFNKTMGDQLGYKIVKQCPTAHAGLNYICTIHALCYRLHKQLTGHVTEVAESYVEKKLAKQVIEEVWGSAEEDELPTWTELLQVVNGAKAEGLGEDEDTLYYLKVVPDHAAKLHVARAKFDAKMRGEGKISFTDMLFQVDYALRTDAEYRRRAQSLFDYLIIDEGQDVSRQAMRIARTLVAKHNRLFIVGDQDQLLYRWLRASPEFNIGEGVREAFGDQLVELKLETNYRSGTKIVAVGQKLIGYNYGDYGGPYPQEFMKACRAREGAPEGISQLLGVYQTPADEARAIAEKIAQEIGGGVRKAGDYMATSRTKAYLAYLEAALMRMQVPYVNISGGSFWLQRHIQDVLNYLKLVYDPNDKDAFDRVKNIASNEMTMPWRGSAQYGQYCSTRFLGDEFLRACNGRMSNMWNAAQQKSTWKPGVEDLQGLYDELCKGKDLQGVGLVLTIKKVLNLCYLKYLRVEEGLQSDENSAKEEDFEMMLDVAERLGDWKKFFAFVQQSVENAKRTKDADHSKLMKIGTIYAFKGDERPVVYNMGWGEGEAQTPQGPQPAGMLPHTFDLVPTPSSGVFNLTSKGRIDDARCVAFVAATRAIDEAWFSYAVEYRNATFGPSRFLIEAGLVDDPAVDAGESYDLAELRQEAGESAGDYFDVQ